MKISYDYSDMIDEIKDIFKKALKSTLHLSFKVV